MKHKTAPGYSGSGGGSSRFAGKVDEESLVRRIRALLDEIQGDADPHLLNRYRSIFRKEVSFFRRSYLAAYLLLLADQGKPQGRRREAPAGNREGQPRRRGGRADEPARGGERREDFKPQEEAHFLPEEEAARLFVSIGRNRKVFPREIIGLLSTKARIARGDIGGIRILDNYSFVQVRVSVADAVIEALNGQGFRGRTLTVSYARTKKEGDAEPAMSGIADSGRISDSGGIAESGRNSESAAGSGEREFSGNG
ncbi:MAG: DbpA RNA binding domain-containing protein [Treponema sp.]|jgi:hypothetical protein|nr:DbpA RNA binding domain-containing protein [Treponema sp.]